MVRKAVQAGLKGEEKMKTLRFEGYGDDTFGQYGVTNKDYDNCASGTPIQCIVDCGSQGRVMVVGQYSRITCDNGCWMIGISKVEEDDFLPDSNYRYCRADMSYSPALRMDVPDDFRLIWFDDERKVGE